MFELWTHLLFVYVAVLLPWGAYRRGRRMVASAAAGADPSLRVVAPARGRVYRATILTQWLVALALLATFWKVGIPWAGLGLAAPRPLPLLVVVAALAVALPLFLAWRRRRLRDPSATERLRVRFAAIEWLLPRTQGERRGFALLAITAGICEELLYRGFLLWYLAVLVGPIGAAAVGTALFGLAHAYQGWRNAGRAATAGLAHWAIYLATGSIVPGIVLHIAIDLDSMVVMGRAFEAVRDS